MQIWNATKATIILRIRSYHHDFVTHTIKPGDRAETDLNADVKIVIEELTVPKRKKKTG